MPPFVHLAARDSNVGIVFQQQSPANPGATNIGYTRLEHYDIAGPGTPAIRTYPISRLNTTMGPWEHPSIDIVAQRSDGCGIGQRHNVLCTGR